MGRARLLRAARLSLLPNVEKNQVDALKGRSIDPNNEHLVPWQSGFTGLAYNPELTGFEVTQGHRPVDPSSRARSRC